MGGGEKPMTCSMGPTPWPEGRKDRKRLPQKTFSQRPNVPSTATKEKKGDKPSHHFQDRIENVPSRSQKMFTSCDQKRKGKKKGRENRIKNDSVRVMANQSPGREGY